MKRIFWSVCALLLLAGHAKAADDSVQGLYRAVLQHEGSPFYQVANITLRTVQGAGQLKISANVRVFFGDFNSNEFLTYEFDEVPYNFITGQMSIKSEKNDVSLLGIFKPTQGTIEGEWYSTIIGKVGKFKAMKNTAPTTPTDGVAVKTLTGQYKGSIKNTHPESNLPERATISLVTTQDTSGLSPVMKVSGNLRLYLGDFGSFEFIEMKLSDIQYNFYSRYLTMKTEQYGLTIKGQMSQEGEFTGAVFADGLGEAGTATLKRVN